MLLPGRTCATNQDVELFSFKQNSSTIFLSERLWWGHGPGRQKPKYCSGISVGNTNNPLLTAMLISIVVKSTDVCINKVFKQIPVVPYLPYTGLSHFSAGRYLLALAHLIPRFSISIASGTLLK